MTAQPQAAPVDAETATLLDVIATDRVHEDDRAKVEAAIREAARLSDSGTRVFPNHVRRLLRNEHGSTVYPPVIGATICALVRQGVLVFENEWQVTDGSPSRNNGKPARVYRLTT